MLCIDRKVLCLGIIQSLFEGSMYTFVLEWTPALTPSEFQYHHKDTVDPRSHHALAAQTMDTDDIDEDGHRGAIPHGFIFAAFMVEFLAVLHSDARTGCFYMKIKQQNVKYGETCRII